MFINLCFAAVVVAAAPSDGEILDAYLAHCAPNYSDEHAMLGQKFRSPGYHTKIPDDTWVHTTRGSLEYAVALMARGQDQDIQRAAKVIRKVISLQDQNPKSRTCGIWPWLMEEPLDKMGAPDFNWADFCGAMLAQMLHDYPEKLPEAVKAEMRQSLLLAAQAIKRRSVGPDYTNIALMGGGVCAAAGELLDDKELLDYGRQRLEKLVEHTQKHGSFNEFNSPTYTMVALQEAERTLHLVRDEATRKAAEWLRRKSWQIIADSFHPGTQQWAGPHSRAYADYIHPSTAASLSRQTGVAIKPHDAATNRRAVAYPMFNALPCPDEYREQFVKLTAEDVERRQIFVRRPEPQRAIAGVTWLSAEACLGTVSESTFWTQRRPVIAYWKTAEDPAVVFRVRFLHNGRDFCSMGCRMVQQGPRVLLMLLPQKNQGSWHPHLDRPADGRFLAKDLRLRVELRGNGVECKVGEAGRYELIAGGHRVVVHPAKPPQDVVPYRWEVGKDRDASYIDAVYHAGDEQAFDWKNPPQMLAAVGLELLDRQAAVAAESPKWENDATEAAAWTPAKDVVLRVTRLDR